MPKHRLIFSERDLSTASEEIIKKVDRAVLAAAFKIRDEMREQFKKDITLYKYATRDYYRMAGGIMVGKLSNSKVKIHAFGPKQNDGTWKARFFVGSTTYRKNNKGNKGFIKANEAVDDGLRNGNQILSTYIKNTIDN